MDVLFFSFFYFLRPSPQKFFKFFWAWLEGTEPRTPTPKKPPLFGHYHFKKACIYVVEKSQRECTKKGTTDEVCDKQSKREMYAKEAGMEVVEGRKIRHHSHQIQ